MTLDTRARRAAQGIHRAVRVMEMSSTQAAFTIQRFDRFRDRGTRNRRLAAAVVGLATSLAVIAGAALLPSDPSDVGGQETPTQGPSVSGSTPAFVDVQTGEITPLPEGILPDGASEAIPFYRVSPDGTKLAFQRCCSAPAPTFVAGVDGTHVRRVTPGGIDAVGASWSPDGSMLVYQGREGSPYDIGDLFVVDINTEEVRQITNLKPEMNPWWFMWPSFASDGNSILFHLPRRHEGPSDQRWDLWSVPMTGGEPVLVRRNAAFGTSSPDGRMLAYLSPMNPKNATGGKLWIVGAAGADPQLLVEEEGIWWPSWSPDGTRIAYGVGTDEIHVVDVVTGESARVAEGATAEWIDDHTLVVAPYCCRG